MFCPNCKTEYRDGFTQCSDCGAALVESLDDAPRAADGLSRQSDDVPELFWSGHDRRAYQEFCTALKAANIRFMDQPRPRFIYNSVHPPLEIWTSKLDHDAVLKVHQTVTGETDEELKGTESLSDLQQTRRSTPNPYHDPSKPTRASKVFGTLDSENAEAVSSTESPHEAEDDSDTWGDRPTDYFSSDSPDNIFVGEFFEEDATSNVYEGEIELAESVKVCLREVGIPCAVDEPEDPSGSAKVRVLPEHEARAKEIVREVIEGPRPE